MNKDEEQHLDNDGRPLPPLKDTRRNIVDLIREDAERLLAKMTTDRKGLFLVKESNDWLEDAQHLPTPTMLFGELWHEGELCILFADTNVGKSILAVQIADSISRGVPIEGMRLDTPAQPVVYFDFELFSKQFEARYSKDFTDHYSFHDNFYRAELNPDMPGMDGCDTFEDCIMLSLEYIVKDIGTKVLIIDNITFLGSENEQASDALPLMKKLQLFKKRLGISLLVLAHTPKRDTGRPLTKNDLQGSRMIMNFCDSSFCIGESSQDKSTRYIKQIKARNTEFVYTADNVLVAEVEKPHNFLQFTITGVGKEAHHLQEADEVQRLLQIQEAQKLYHEAGMTIRAIAEQMGISKSVIGRYIKKAG